MCPSQRVMQNFLRILRVKVEVWADAANTGSVTVAPAVIAEFERDISAVTGSQWGKAEVIPSSLTENQFGTHAVGVYLFGSSGA